ncbi:MAG: DNA internalization-related competence protein ComEC/Rec2 [Rhodothermia bacterium]|nr:DNA internalization-related competence protein ComEC/Rec2 [Rhodothermia bacterium]
MRTPAFRIALGLAIGILFADSLPTPRVTPTILVGAIGTVLVALVCLAWCHRAGPRISAPCKPAFSMALALLCGVVSYVRVVDRDSSAWRDLLQDDEELEFTGRIVRISASASGPRYTMDRLVVLPREEVFGGKLLVYANAEVDNDVQLGSRVSVLGTLRALPAHRNPSDFNYGRFLHRRGFKAIAYVEHGTVHPLAQPSTAKWIGRIRRSIRENIRSGVSDSDARAMLVALMLGDRSGISPELRDDFVDAGLVHLLAVSGLHVMVVGFVFFNIAGPVLRRCRLKWGDVEFIRVAITLLLLLTYMNLTGKPDSVVRAVIMASILIIAPLVRRNSGSLNSLWIAAAVILSFSPWSLFEAGFQLSVSAVAGIVTFNPMMENARALQRLAATVGKVIVSNVTVTASATVGVAPVLLYHFGEVSLAGLLLNISSVPLTALSLMSGVLGVVLSAAPGSADALEMIYIRASEVSLLMIIETARLGSEYLGVLSVRVFPTAPILLAAVFTSWALARRPRSGRWSLLGDAIICVVVSQARHVQNHALQRTDVIFFDVGQGDATLIRTASGRTMLVDAGDRRRGISPAERSIVPHLRRLNAARLDLAVLSHAHADHIGGVLELFDHVEIGRIATAHTPSQSRVLARIKRLADSTRTPVTYVETGDTLFLDPSLSIQVLWPHRKDIMRMTENDRSIVLRVQAAAGTLLLTGDVERPAESEIVADFRRILPAAIVKVPHHGSRTSSTNLMLRAIGRSTLRPRYAIVSVGERNRYGLPDEEVLSNWHEHDYEVLQTAERGAVWFTMGRNGIRIRDWSSRPPPS